jgi:hypothetical protein
MVLRGHVVSCVVLCGIPATSIASIFMLRKVLGAETLAFLGRGRALNSGQVPLDRVIQITVIAERKIAGSAVSRSR